MQKINISGKKIVGNFAYVIGPVVHTYLKTKYRIPRVRHIVVSHATNKLCQRTSDFFDDL